MHSFPRSQASRRNRNATARHVCRMCAGRGMPPSDAANARRWCTEVASGGATWRCAVPWSQPSGGSALGPLFLASQAHPTPPSKIGLDKSAARPPKPEFTKSRDCERTQLVGGERPSHKPQILNLHTNTPRRTLGPGPGVRTDKDSQRKTSQPDYTSVTDTISILLHDTNRHGSISSGW